MKPGFLIHYKGELEPRFCPMIGDKIIKTNIYWMDKIPVNKHENGILMFVEPFDYSKETTTATAIETTTAMAMATATAATVTGTVTATAVATATVMATAMAMTVAMASAASKSSKSSRSSTVMVTTHDVNVMELARKEFEETGKISGGIFLNGDGRKIWVSRYDIEELINDE